MHAAGVASLCRDAISELCEHRRVRSCRQKRSAAVHSGA